MEISLYALGAKGSDSILRTWCEGQLFHFTHLVRRAVISFYALGAVRRTVISFYALGAMGSDLILRTWCEEQ